MSFISSFEQDLGIIPGRFQHYEYLQHDNMILRLSLTKSDVYIQVIVLFRERRP